MSGYLYCDGSTFDENDYPALYMYLGTNVLPDYRECVMVGAEQNTTDTIANHDVYGEGEFKDDQLQSHTHNMGFNTNGYSQFTSYNDYMTVGYGINHTDTNSGGGTTTHGKQKAVYVYIKATSGLAENQQENVLNDVKGYVNNSNSYSTNEVKTGGKWIDEKPIYRKTISCGALPNNTTKNVAHGINNLGRVISANGTAADNNTGKVLPIPYASDNYIGFSIDKTNIAIFTVREVANYADTYVTIEYTKTTD